MEEERAGGRDIKRGREKDSDSERGRQGERGSAGVRDSERGKEKACMPSVRLQTPEMWRTSSLDS